MPVVLAVMPVVFAVTPVVFAVTPVVLAVTREWREAGYHAVSQHAVLVLLISACPSSNGIQKFSVSSQNIAVVFVAVWVRQSSDPPDAFRN